VENKRSFLGWFLNRKPKPSPTIDEEGGLFDDSIFDHSNFVPLVSNVSTKKFWDSAGSAALEKVISGLDSSFLELQKATASSSYSLFSYIDTDFATVDALCQLDSSIQMMVERLSALTLKEGYRVYGKNQGAVDYINARIHHFPFLSRSFESGTAYTFKLFLYAATMSLIKYANIFILYTSFKKGTKIGKRTLEAIEPRNDPIAIPVVMPPLQKSTSSTSGKEEYTPIDTSIDIKLDSTRVVHYAPKTTGLDNYGFPNLMSIYYDVLNLRGVEQAVLALIQRSLYPIIHVKVKEDSTFVPDVMTRKIERLDEQLKAKAPENALVTEDTVEIKVIGSESFALRASPYLDYIFTRMIGGMHGSRSQFGYGGGEASELDASSYAAVEQLQRLLEDFVVYFFFIPTLLEANFDPLTNPDDCVYFELISPDINKRMRIENNQIQQWVNSLGGLNEIRHSIGRDEYNPTIHGPLFSELVGQAQSNFAGATAAPQNQYTKNSQELPSAELMSIAGELLNTDISDIKDHYEDWIDAIVAGLSISGYTQADREAKARNIISLIIDSEEVPSITKIYDRMV